MPTQYESRTGYRVVWPTSEVVWYSQKDDWGNLYLYDLATGALRNRITTGEGPVETIVKVDSATRTIWVEAYGRERGQDPYFSHLYKTALDGRGWTSLTPEWQPAGPCTPPGFEMLEQAGPSVIVCPGAAFATEKWPAHPTKFMSQN